MDVDQKRVGQDRLASKLGQVWMHPMERVWQPTCSRTSSMTGTGPGCLLT